MNFIALRTSFFIAEDLEGSTLYLFLIISLSAFLNNSAYFGKTPNASMDMSAV